MRFNISIGLLLVTAKALITKAESVTFKVLAVNGTPILNIDGQEHTMSLDKYPLYKVNVDIKNFPVNYNYIIDYGNNEKEEEAFVRQRLEDDESLNEFFNRTITVKKHPELPRAYEAFPYFEQSKLYDDTFVATFIVNCDEAQLQGLYADTSAKEKIPAEIIYASPYDVKTFSEASMGLSGQSTRDVAKLSYKFKNLKNGKKELFNRSSIKLRAEHMDFSYLRDKIYGDIVNTLGVPTAQNTFARLYINGRDIGFFDVSDDITNGRYLRETFNNGNKYDASVVNEIYKADCSELTGVYGDLGYYGDDVNNEMYAIYSYKGNDETMLSLDHVAKDIIPLVKEIDDYKNGQTNEMPIDVDTFLKSMAMEFLGGAIDNYWNKPGNYYLFRDNSKGIWYFHDADFHYSFGINNEKDAMLSTPLSEYPPKVAELIGKERAPLDALRQDPEMEAKFQDIFKRLLKTSYNPNALFPRIDSLAELIREDVLWDISILPKENPNPITESYSTDTIDLFDKETMGEDINGAFGGYPLKYFIQNKASLIAQELNTDVPVEYEKNLGLVKTPVATADVQSDSASIKTLSWSMGLTLITLFITMILY